MLRLCGVWCRRDTTLLKGLGDLEGIKVFGGILRTMCLKGDPSPGKTDAPKGIKVKKIQVY